MSPCTWGSIAGYREGAEYETQVLKDGPLWLEQAAAGPRTEIVDPQGGERAKYRVVVRGETPLAPADFDFAYMGLVGVTNPIYVGDE
ncbi:MAG: hypothetical protein VX899_00640 [Myxococcota bacterium]|nr:hypothetical protein [Myxococcota bacterium]